MSKKAVIIFGITDLAELLYSYLCEDSNFKVVGFTADRQYIHNLNTFCDHPVIPFDELDKFLFTPERVSIFVCVGYTKMNSVRKDVFERVLKKGYSIESYFHPSASIYTDSFGIGNIVFPNVMIDRFTSVGDGNIFYSNRFVAHHSSIGNYNFFAVKCCCCGHVTMKNNCFIGANSTIRNGVTLEEYTLVGAAAYVSRNTVKNGVYVPSKTIAMLNKDSLDINF